MVCLFQPTAPALSYPELTLNYCISRLGDRWFIEGERGDSMAFYLVL
ncbi:MAG: hypothetical protein LVT47_12450 [Cyanobacteria bacterium LVE1205-1]